MNTESLPVFVEAWDTLTLARTVTLTATCYLGLDLDLDLEHDQLMHGGDAGVSRRCRHGLARIGGAWARWTTDPRLGAHSLPRSGTQRRGPLSQRLPVHAWQHNSRTKMRWSCQVRTRSLHAHRSFKSQREGH